ncbi:MAG: glycosyltransferase [Promethearchaeota archaeon]
MSEKNRLVVVLPARNEEAFIEGTIKSVEKQTLKPEILLVVDDGSTDATAAIVRKHSWVKLLMKTDRGFRYRGAGVAVAVNQGVKEITRLAPDWAFLCKLDADIILPPDYFESLINLMNAPENRRLGIVSGVVKGEATNLEHPRGAARIYRRQCWEDIGGKLQEIHGWDTYTDLRARQFRWITRGIQEIEVIQRRPTAGREQSLSVAFQVGRMMYLLGYHPLVAFARGIKLLRKNPLATIILILSNALSRFSRGLRILPKDYYQYVNQEQKARITQLIVKLLGGRRG